MEKWKKPLLIVHERRLEENVLGVCKLSTAGTGADDDNSSCQWLDYVCDRCNSFSTS